MRRLFALFFAASVLVIPAGCATTDDSNGDDDVIDARASTDTGEGQCDFCSATDDCCSGFCVDTQTNTTHCGECNRGCVMPTADGCSLGSCTCNFGTECSGSTQCCPGLGCKDTQTDALNCGGCGVPCGEAESCQAGGCVCAAASAACVAPTADCCETGCVNLQTDPLNCGLCGKVCGGASTCEGGACVYNCEPACTADDGFMPGCCSAGCTDMFLDGLNCGACDVVCPSTICLAGACF